MATSEGFKRLHSAYGYLDEMMDGAPAGVSSCLKCNLYINNFFLMMLPLLMVFVRPASVSCYVQCISE